MNLDDFFRRADFLLDDVKSMEKMTINEQERAYVSLMVDFSKWNTQFFKYLIDKKVPYSKVHPIIDSGLEEERKIWGIHIRTPHGKKNVKLIKRALIASMRFMKEELHLGKASGKADYYSQGLEIHLENGFIRYKNGDPVNISKGDIVHDFLTLLVSNLNQKIKHEDVWDFITMKGKKGTSSTYSKAQITSWFGELKKKFIKAGLPDDMWKKMFITRGGYGLRMMN